LQQIADILELDVPTTGLTDTLRTMIMTKSLHGMDVLPPNVNADLHFDWVCLG
jgi:hypothetical protein